jgi:flagellin
MAYSINTNVAGLQAQDYLRVTSDFQQKTINRVTSGLRIVSSGDDAAGLSIANSFRSDRAVLSQGIRNANDGLSSLQTIDGGVNNISQLLDRARTLAAQSSSGTLSGTGTRGTLNTEFQSVLTEIDRQAQAIGLDTGGTFAKSLSVFIGGGRSNNGIDSVTNGSVAVDLSASSVDSKSLGLKGLQAAGGTAGTTDIGGGTSNATSVANILGVAANTTSEGVAGYTDFYFRGAGFSDGNRVKVSVNLAGVTDTGSLVAALNTAIGSTGSGSGGATTAFKNANIQASVTTDAATGKQRLAFTSSTNAFQVAGGDRVSSALLGNFSAGATGVDLAYSVTGGANVAATGAVFAANSNTIVRIQGGSLASAVDLTLSSGAGGSTVDAALASLTSLVSNNAALQAAGISLSTSALGSPLAFTSKRGEKFEVLAAGDTVTTAASNGLLGLGKFQLATAAGTSFDYSSVTGSGGAFNTAAANNYVFSVGGGAATSAFTITNDTNSTAVTTAAAFNAAFSANSTLQSAGLVADGSSGQIVISSANGSNFRLDLAANTGINLGFGSTTSTSTYTANTASGSLNSATVNSGGAAATGLITFAGIRSGGDDQTLTFSALDSSGSEKSTSLVLGNDATLHNGRSIDEAISAINAKLQQTNVPTLQKIVAVKENDSGTEKIRFLSSNSSFKVGIGTNAGTVGLGSQGAVADTTALAGGAAVDISTQAGAQNAVTAVANAVAALGNAQAVVGKAQNQFNFAVNLASTQLTNLAAAESRIRDADLASEAANLTKAQILQQAGIAALAQANSAPQAVLSLLRG